MFQIKITEDDVPGGKLVYNTVEQHSVAQLKRWLRCRKCTVKGKKQDLVKRLVEVIFVSYF